MVYQGKIIRFKIGFNGLGHTANEHIKPKIAHLITMSFIQRQPFLVKST